MAIDITSAIKIFQFHFSLKFLLSYKNTVLIIWMHICLLYQQVRFEFLLTKVTTTLYDFERFLCKEFWDYKMYIALYTVHESNLTFVCSVPAFIKEKLIDHIIKNQYHLSSWGLQDVIIRDKSVLDKLVMQVSFRNIIFMLMYSYFSVVCVHADMHTHTHSGGSRGVSLVSVETPFKILKCKFWKNKKF